jgi:glutamyl-tRNA reductase
VDSATRLLINRLLHEPSALLREMAAATPAERAEAERLLARLFRLAGGDEGDEG